MDAESPSAKFVYQMQPSESLQELVLARFGARVRELRERAGFSQEEFAHLAGLDRSYIGQVERGERNVSLFNIIKMAKGLNVPPSKLFSTLDGDF